MYESVLEADWIEFREGIMFYLCECLRRLHMFLMGQT